MWNIGSGRTQKGKNKDKKELETSVYEYILNVNVNLPAFSIATITTIMETHQNSNT